MSERHRGPSQPGMSRRMKLLPSPSLRRKRAGAPSPSQEGPDKALAPTPTPCPSGCIVRRPTPSELRRVQGPLLIRAGSRSSPPLDPGKLPRGENPGPGKGLCLVVVIWEHNTPKFPTGGSLLYPGGRGVRGPTWAQVCARTFNAGLSSLCDLAGGGDAPDAIKRSEKTSPCLAFRPSAAKPITNQACTSCTYSPPSTAVPPGSPEPPPWLPSPLWRKRPPRGRVTGGPLQPSPVSPLYPWRTPLFLPIRRGRRRVRPLFTLPRVAHPPLGSHGGMTMSRALARPGLEQGAEAPELAA
ncbi:hypothetical protein GWK47_021874 [Chionoecetes opilio]|uniref:Uncharacterized protein n=1 Tax=Chionoecetes opilio TaxID=41210 RepID=A0A8J4XNZ2_CHIOP|nr:hypothetical protein GWK47_021874 [Chionoecetes opilio]